MEVTNMDAYTILYQAREQMKVNYQIVRLIQQTTSEEGYEFSSNPEKQAEEIRRIAIAGLEEGIQVIRWEFPPSVSRRMQKYYNQNKDVLLETFTHKVREELMQYSIKHK